MQWILNIAYNLLSTIFAQLGSVLMPDWMSDIVTGLSYYIQVANYFIPVGTYVTVALSVLSVTIILMIISALLQIF